MEIENWFGVVAPKGTPQDKLTELSGWFKAALDAPESKTKLAAQYLYTGGPCGADFGAMISKSHDAYGRGVREANIKVQ